MFCKQIIFTVLLNLNFGSLNLLHQNYWHVWETNLQKPDIGYLNNYVKVNRLKKEKTLLDIYEEIILKFRSRMKKGIPEWGLPMMDPLTVKGLIIEDNIYGQWANYTFATPNIKGLSNFNIDRLEYENKTLVLKICFPKIHVSLASFL